MKYMANKQIHGSMLHSYMIFACCCGGVRSQRKLSCDDEKPSTMCTSDRYVTLRLAKKKLNDNKNYDINILVEKGESLCFVTEFSSHWNYYQSRDS